MRFFITISLIHLLVNFSFTTVIHVPKECTSIQEGIISAKAGDTVLVNPGTYMENINFAGRNIVLASLTATSGNASYKHRTIIDGNYHGSVISFKNGEDSTAQVNGFTIINGSSEKGGGIYCSGSSPTLVNLVIKNNNAFLGGGGGISCYKGSNAHIENVVIKSNTAAGIIGGGILCSESHIKLENVQINDNTAYYGGGIACYGSYLEIIHTKLYNNIAKGYGGGLWCRKSNIDLNHVRIDNNSAFAKGGGIRSIESKLNFSNMTICNNSAELGGGGICMDKRSNLDFCSENRCNILLNRSNLGFGNDIYLTTKIPDLINVILDTFSVNNVTDRYIFPIENFNINLINEKIKPVKNDLYVSPNGNDSNSGTSPSDPLKSVNLALMKIVADSLNPYTVYLANGKYNRSESPYPFRIFIPDYVSIKGESSSGVYINADNQENVFVLNNNHGSRIENLTITGGSSRYGGGIRCENSKLDLINVTITGNEAERLAGKGGMGGAIYITESDLNLTNVNIKNNAAGWGGGIYYHKSTSIMQNVQVSENITWKRGGGLFFNSSAVTLKDVTITQNSAKEFGGGVFCARSDICLKCVSILKNKSELCGGGIYFMGASEVNFCCENRCSIYSNQAQTGNDLYNLERFNIIKVTLDMFTVLNPTEVYAYRLDRFKFDVQKGILPYWQDKEPKYPVAQSLSQNYPNPFNPSTMIQYTVGEYDHSPSFVDLSVYNLLGQKVATLVSEKQRPGYYEVEWDASGFASEVYYYNLTTSQGFTQTKKLVLIR